MQQSFDRVLLSPFPVLLTMESSLPVPLTMESPLPPLTRVSCAVPGRLDQLVDVGRLDQIVSTYRSTPWAWPLVDAVGLARNVCLAATHAC